MANSEHVGPFLKTSPRVISKRLKARVEDREWRNVCGLVDARDKRRCQVTRIVLAAGAVDAWMALERHHLELRSQNKSRRFTAVNVWTVSRAVHQLIHAGALLVLNKRSQPAKDVREIDHLAWNRRIVARGDEPCRIKGWPLVELDAVKD